MKRRLGIVGLLIVLLGAFLLWRQRKDTASDQREPGATEVVRPSEKLPGHAPVTSRPVAGAKKPSSVEAAPTSMPMNGDGGALFGPLIAVGQGQALAESLEKNAANAESSVEALCAESDKLRARSPMKEPPSHDRDAAEFMAPLIDYTAPLNDPPGRLHLPDDLRDKLNAPGNDWGAKITAADLASLDFSWMVALAQFDHWSVFGAGRLKAFKGGDFFETPMPNYAVLEQWAKLRFALARRRGDHEAASNEVRHMADLVRSQGTFIAEAVAIGLYGIDARARETAIAAGADVSGWSAADRDALASERKVHFASMYFTYPGVKPDVLRRAVGCMPMPCAALLEGTTANRASGPMRATTSR